MANLQNYTSGISADRSTAFIQRQVIDRGAKYVQLELGDNKEVVAISFQLAVSGKDVQFKVQANITACTQKLEAMLTPRSRPETRKKIPKQAERTAWKILADYVEVQMTMIDLGQKDMMEVFLADVYDPASQQTFYQNLKAGDFKRLLGKGVG